MTDMDAATQSPADPIVDDDEDAEEHCVASDLQATGKQVILDQLAQFPDDASLEEIVEQLRMIAAVRIALAEADRGEGIPIEELEREIKTWKF